MMERLFRHPGWLKFFSAILAVMLWAYVMPRYMAETQRTFDVPLTVVQNPNPTYEILEDLPTTVQIRADGKNFVISRLKKENFKAYLDLGKVADIGKATQLQIDLKVDESYRAQFDATVNPKSIQVTLVDHKTVKRPLKLEDPTGFVSYNGWEYRYTAHVDAEEATFSGRSDYLALVKQGSLAVAGPDLTPELTSVERSVTPVDAAGRAVKVSSPKLPVRLEWVKLPPGKPFRVQVPTVGLLPAGLALTAVETDPPTVSVRATSLEGKLPDKDVIQTEPLDLTGRTESFTTQLRLLPAPGTIAGAERVTVKVRITEQAVEQVYKGIRLTTRGAVGGAQVTLSVTDVQVRLQGSYAAMKGLSPADISAYVDLEGIPAGQHTLPVKVGLPPGVTNISTDPATVEVSVILP